MRDPQRDDIIVLPGEWWCPDCSRARDVSVTVEAQGPVCGCGTPLELTGEGDDDPYPEDPDWRE